jgi:hypothetical protein
LSAIRWRLGFLKDDGTFEDLVDVRENEDEGGWLPLREVQYRWRRTKHGRMAYLLWAVRDVVWGDPEDCDWQDCDDYDGFPDPGGRRRAEREARLAAR